LFAVGVTIETNEEYQRRARKLEGSKEESTEYRVLNQRKGQPMEGEVTTEEGKGAPFN